MERIEIEILGWIAQKKSEQATIHIFLFFGVRLAGE